MQSVFSELAADQNLVHGIYNYCDGWCTYCGMTSRCLVRLASERLRSELRADPTATVEGAAALTREVARVNGGMTPVPDAGLRLDEALEQESGPPKPAEGLALQYAILSELFLEANHWNPPAEDQRRPGGQPTPFDVIAWYHLVIAAKLHRALTPVAQTGPVDGVVTSDAAGSAKVALIGIDRSRKALEALSRDRDRSGAPQLLNLLDQLGPMVESLFPDARSFVRPGFDAPM